MLTVVSFTGFTVFVALYVTYRLRKDKMNSSDDYFLGGRSLTGVVIAGSMLLTNISTEHLIGMKTVLLLLPGKLPPQLRLL